MEASNIEQQISKAIGTIYLQAILFEILTHEDRFYVANDFVSHVHIIPSKSSGRFFFDEKEGTMGASCPDQYIGGFEPSRREYFTFEVTKRLFGFTPVSHSQRNFINCGAEVIEWKFKLHPETIAGPKLAQAIFKTHEVFLTYSNQNYPHRHPEADKSLTLDFDEAIARPKFSELSDHESNNLLKNLHDAIKEFSQLKTMCGLHGHFGPIHDYVQTSIPTIYDTGVFKPPSDQ